VLVLGLGLAVTSVLAADRNVTIRDFAYAPGSVTIRVGDSVTWTNRDSVAHTATARNGSFDTGLLADGASRSIRFTAAGTYRYICTPHPDMTGTVVVRAVASGGRPPDTDTAAARDPVADEGSEAPEVATLAVVGGLAFLVARWAIGRRRETA
jgi:plastocyanin